MSEPGPDYTGLIAAGMAGAAVAYPEYRVTSPGDAAPTSGASLDEVLGAADVVDEAPGAPPDAAVEVDPNPIDVSAMGGGVLQWWLDRDEAAATQAAADAMNAEMAGAAVPGSDGPDLGWQPFPPGPEGMIPQ